MPFGSCFFEARFTRLLRAAPERSSPQPDTAELAAFKIFRGIPIPIATKLPLQQDPLRLSTNRSKNRSCLLKTVPRKPDHSKNNCRTKRFVSICPHWFELVSRATLAPLNGKGGTMVDLQAVEIELQNARRARINAELACCDIEELTEEIRQSHDAFLRGIAERRSLRLH